VNQQRALAAYVVLLQDAAARRSLLVFALMFLGHLLKDDCSAFHYTLCRELDWAAQGGHRLLGALPREHGKTTLGTIALALREVCLGSKQNILLVAANRAEGAAKLRQIVDELENNARLRAAFEMRVRPARDNRGLNVAYADSEIVLAGGARLSVLGAGGKARGQLARGRRLDLVILDDPEDDALVASARRRYRLRSWVERALINALDVRCGSLVWLGTLLHHDSVLAQMIKEQGPGDKQVQGLRFKVQASTSTAASSLEPSSSSTETWHVLRLAAIDDAGRVLWPQRWSIKLLNERREEIGDAAFAQEYLNQPVSLAGQLFCPGDFRTYDAAAVRYRDGEWSIDAKVQGSWFKVQATATTAPAAGEPFPLNLEPLLVAIGVDPAIRQREEADYFAAVVVGITEKVEEAGLGARASLPVIHGDETDGGGPGQNGGQGRPPSSAKPRIYVLEVLRLRERFSEQLAELARLAARWLPRVIGIEATAYQEALAQAAIDQGLPVKPLRSSRPKAVRIAAASTHSSQGRMYLPLQGAWVSEFRAEAEQYPAGGHDDQLDALARALEAGLPLLGGNAEVVAAERRREGIRGF